MADVLLSVKLEVATGTWLELDDEANGYEVGSGSFASRQIAHRQRKAGEQPWVEGGTVVSSVRELIVEPLEVYVEGNGSQYLFETRRKVITDALEQLVFGIRKQIGDALEEWSCVPSDYSIDTSQPLMVATQGLIKAQIAYQPSTTLTEVVP